MEKSILSIGLFSTERPPVVDPLNNGQGTVHYNHNIVEVGVVKDEQGSVVDTKPYNEDDGLEKGYVYDCVRVEYPTTADNIFSTLLTAKYPAKTESKLVNEYQSATFGLLPESYKKPYEDFLKDRLAIREMVDNDCNALNIPIDND